MLVRFQSRIEERPAGPLQYFSSPETECRNKRTARFIARCKRFGFLLALPKTVNEREDAIVPRTSGRAARLPADWTTSHRSPDRTSRPLKTASYVAHPVAYVSPSQSPSRRHSYTLTGRRPSSGSPKTFVPKSEGSTCRCSTADCLAKFEPGRADEAPPCQKRFALPVYCTRQPRPLGDL